VTVEIDPEGILSKLSVIDPETKAEDMTFDFSGDVFIHYCELLDLIVSHPIFHMLQQTTVAHLHAGHYAVTVTPL
jgi:hypothetical protein